MFTGLIEEVGTLHGVVSSTSSLKLDIACPGIAPSLAGGESVAVDGICLTVEGHHAGGFSCFASPETVERTALRQRKPGSPVNLERALPLGGRLGGHLVSGHVDATGTFLGSQKIDGAWEVRIGAAADFLRQCIQKGSVAIDGISLTIAALDSDSIVLWIIPETWDRTTLAHRQSGDVVNLESDMIGKYVFRFLETAGIGGPAGAGSAAERDARFRDLLSGGGWGAR